MAHFLEASDLDWLLHNFAPYWLGPIAAKLNIPSAFFSILIAACMGFLRPSSAVVHENDDQNKLED
ncbi:hypothetical protein ACSBR2_024316 [Camellia fascicularis]